MDPERRTAVAQYERQAWAVSDARRGKVAPSLPAEDPGTARKPPMRDSSAYLAEHMQSCLFSSFPASKGGLKTRRLRRNVSVSTQADGKATLQVGLSREG